MRIQRTVRADCPASYGTFGALCEDDGHEIAKTCELPDADNPTGHRRIPAGHYRCRRRWSAKHGCEVFEITEVPGRSDIEIHAANWPHQLLGCVALGETIEVIDGALGVTSSRDTMATFMASKAGVDEFWLDVADAV